MSFFDEQNKGTDLYGEKENNIYDPVDNPLLPETYDTDIFGCFYGPIFNLMSFLQWLSLC